MQALFGKARQNFLASLPGFLWIIVQDQYRASCDEKGRRTTQSAIYLEHADHLKAPHCHVIYTLPISIYFNENLSKAYPDLPHMLPMIKIREENGRICADGLDAMRRVIVQRVQIESVFENAKSVDKFCLASGGHIRDLMHLLRYACDYSAERITTLAVDKAIRALVREYDRLVKDVDLPRLVRSHREKGLPSDAEYALLPYHLIVLQEALQSFGEALQLARETNNAEGLFNVSRDLGTLLCQAGQKEQGLALLGQALEVGQQMGHPNRPQAEEMLRQYN